MFLIGVLTGVLVGFAAVFALVVLISRKRDEGLSEAAKKTDELLVLNDERNRLLSIIADALSEDTRRGGGDE